nr:phosphoglucan phosphatase LSF1, chloroplastic isoform X3 [Arachis hypogaea]
MLLLRFTTNPHPPPPFLPCITNATSSSFCPTHRSLFNNGNKNCFVRSNVRTHTLRVFAMSDSKAYKMNLNQYLVTLERPLGIRFALTADGNIIVHSLTKGGNAERSRIIMVGDTLKKLGDSSQNKLVEIKDVGDTQKVLNEQANSFSLVLERPTSPFPIQLLHKMIDLEILFNRGRVPIISWSKTLLASNLQPSSESSGNSGFVVFNSKFLTLKGSQLLGNQNQDAITYGERNFITQQTTQLACIFTGEACGDGEWAHGSFPLEEYIQALDRSKDEMYYNHSLGMRYSKITEQLFVGSCIQTEADVETLSNVEGITAVLNFQSGNEAENWGINVRSINDSCQRNNILMINYSIRPAIAWATWDLIAMVERGKHDGPPTHAVTFVWNGHEEDDVTLVGDFTANWKEPLKAVYQGARHEVEVKLPQGKYYYKFIVNGEWMHSTASPEESDDRGNINNIIVIGETASIQPSVQHQQEFQDANVVKVIERPLNETERFMLAKAARCIAFSICPIRLTPK